MHPDGIGGVAAHDASLVEPLRRRGYLVAALDAFNTGAARAPRDTSDRFFTTYNRTDDANRVQDILTVLAWLKRQPGIRRVSLVGLDRAGLWCLLAQGLAPGLDAVVADADRFETESDEAYLDRLPIPLLRSVGGFETALTLGLGSRLRVHDTGDALRDRRGGGERPGDGGGGEAPGLPGEAHRPGGGGVALGGEVARPPTCGETDEGEDLGDVGIPGSVGAPGQPSAGVVLEADAGPALVPAVGWGRSQWPTGGYGTGTRG